jgi:hypothetical protein
MRKRLQKKPNNFRNYLGPERGLQHFDLSNQKNSEVLEAINILASFIWQPPSFTFCSF